MFMDISILSKRFTEIYNSEAQVYFAPGRVNIIGEHTDYNGGYVLPCTVNFGTYLAIAPAHNDKFRFESTDYTYKAEVDISDLKNKHDDEWVNYVLGAIDQFSQKSVKFTQGINFLYSGDIPGGAGLSGSASVELVTAVALNDILDTGFLMTDLIKMSHLAESNFVGEHNSILDQFAVGLGDASTAIFLNCRTLEYELVPFDLKDHAIIIINTNKPRQSAISLIKERMAECRKALEDLKKVKVGMVDLSDITLEEFERFGPAIEDAIAFRRARHVVSENNRVMQAVSALKRGDLTALGQLMNDSHESLRHDYQVTGVELNTIVNAARKVKGVLGARMTGTGLGGCAVTIVDKRYIEAVINKVGQAYEKEIGLKPLFYVAELGKGISNPLFK